MSKIAYVHNGTAKNGTAKNGSKKKGDAKKKNPSPSLSMSRVKSFLQKNGLKTMPRGKNPATVARSRNGILGNTKSDAKQVGFLMLGAAITKGAGRFLAGFIAPHLSRMSLGKYTTIIADGVVALVAVPFIGQKTLGKEAATFGRLGGLVVMGIDAVNVFAPDTLGQYNPFIDMTPIVLANGQPAFAPEAVAVIADEIANADDPQAAAAKVKGAVYQMDGAFAFDSGGFGSGSEGYSGLRPMSF